MAQAQTLTGAEICHFIWMGNHAHMLCVVRNPAKFVKFYAILQKSLTDMVKKLLGEARLNLWESRPSAIALLDARTVAKRVAYFYANPARANLVSNIREYKGVSSYQAFNDSNNEITASSTKTTPWLSPSFINKLENPTITRAEDARLTAALVGRALRYNDLIITPNSWMKCFGITSIAEALELNSIIRGETDGLELEASKNRRISGDFQPIGMLRLWAMAFMSAHTPKKYGRKIFVMSESPGDRIEYIGRHNDVCQRAHELYQLKYKYGMPVRWPAGIFPPPSPMMACALAY